MGCGKGRVLLAASRYPFGRVIGVELSERLAKTARTNLRTSRLRPRCGAVEIVAADAAHFAVPDDVTVVYVFNAFCGATFEAFLAELIASVDRVPRTVKLLYHSARQHEQVMASGRFAFSHLVAGLRPGRGWAQETGTQLYQLRPERARAPKPVPVLAGR